MEKNSDDENLVDIDFSLGNPLSEGIPWEDYSELEIQTLVKMHFEMLDYDVVWRHLDDPANERGIDLECNRKSDKRKVLVAVKKNPKKEALAQVVELADYKADERIYVYIGGAAQSFRDKLSNFKSKVQFWDEKELESRLNETGLTLQLKIANSKANEAMLSIMRCILHVIEDKSLGPPSSTPNTDTLETLWGLKDRAVTIHKCAGMAQLMLEDSSRFGRPSHEEVQKLVVFILNYIYAYGLLSLQRTFEDLSPELQSLLHHVHKKTRIRSNWLELFQYRQGSVPGAVERVHQDFAKERAKWKGLDSGTFEHEKRIPDTSWTHLDDAAESFRRLSVWSHGLEGTIDYIYEKCVHGEVCE